MRIRLATNIGKADAQRFGLDKSQEGETVTVDRETGDKLIEKGWAVDASKDDEPKPAELKAVPKTDLKTSGDSEPAKEKDKSKDFDKNPHDSDLETKAQAKPEPKADPKPEAKSDHPRSKRY